MRSAGKKIIRTVSVAAVLFITLLIVFSIPARVSKSDQAVFDALFTDMAVDSERLKSDYEYQLEVVSMIQKTALERIHLGVGIPQGEGREPENALRIGQGECYDRSRFMEKAFRYFGLKSRHISVYLRGEGDNRLGTVLKTDAHSHAVSEVKTVNGWLAVDSNYPWISVSSAGRPVPVSETGQDIDYLNPIPANSAPFYSGKGSTVIIYGLYSRHGKFFPPYNRIPDYNLRELLYNFR